MDQSHRPDLRIPFEGRRHPVQVRPLRQRGTDLHQRQLMDPGDLGNPGSVNAVVDHQKLLSRIKAAQNRRLQRRCSGAVHQGHGVAAAQPQGVEELGPDRLEKLGELRLPVADLDAA